MISRTATNEFHYLKLRTTIWQDIICNLFYRNEYIFIMISKLHDINQYSYYNIQILDVTCIFFHFFMIFYPVRIRWNWQPNLKDEFAAVLGIWDMTLIIATILLNSRSMHMDGTSNYPRLKVCCQLSHVRRRKRKTLCFNAHAKIFSWFQS